MDLPVNLTIGPRAGGTERPTAAQDTRPTPANPVRGFSSEAGVEWVVAMLAVGALVVLILFRLAGFQAAIAVRLGG